MIRKVFALVFALVCLFACLTEALAQTEAVVDTANILSASRESEISGRIDRILEKYQFQVMLYLVADGLSLTELRVAAADAFEARGFGPDGVIMALDVSSRKYYFVTAGKGMGIFDDSALDYLEDRVLDYLSENSFAAGADAFVGAAEHVLDRSDLAGVNGKIAKVLDKLPLAAVIGAVLATIVVFVRAAGMKTGHRRNTANQYVIRSNLNRRSDVYLYTTQTKHRIETSSSGGGGGHHGGGGSFHSSSGGSYGGRGGSF